MKWQKQTTAAGRGAGGATRGGRGALWGAVSAGAVAVLGMGVWQFQRANALPDLSIPSPVMPVPNAYDDYARASGLEVSFLGGGDATGEPSTGVGGAKTMRGGGPLPPFKARLALVALNVPAVRALHQGFRHPYLQPPDRSLYHPSSSALNSSKAREMARMLAFSSRACLDAGQAGKAADFGLDGVRFATDVARGGGLLTRLTARGCESNARGPLWEVAQKGDAKTARNAVRRLEEIERNRHPLAATMQEEKYVGLVSAREYFETAGVHEIAKEVASARGAIIGSPGAGGTTLLSPVAVGTIQAQLLVKGRGRIIGDYGAYMDRMIAAARLPYDARVPLPPPPSDPFNKDLFTLSMDALFLRDAETQMLTRLLTVQFALRAYKLERGGAYPATLADLARAGYLRAVPTDPFALPAPGARTNLAPLGYRRVPGKNGATNGFVLYSVGPDGLDDNGKPINNVATSGSRKGRQKNWVEAGTKGDFVVGVNAY